ncbi:hypothetical protein HPB50_021853 [Hyalomma asiaticum]|uniref:Uncharacterized protein n=1 Tax=Hyalomma asiaticum TaxID=266040 RepID=A0ACB7TNX0_HYAAI|nr:hypothetical protein HPB50_021853 [Hyalomma asiaticum]
MGSLVSGTPSMATTSRCGRLRAQTAKSRRPSNVRLTPSSATRRRRASRARRASRSFYCFALATDVGISLSHLPSTSMSTV